MEQLQLKDPTLITAFRWLIKELNTCQYGELAVSFNVHNGKLGSIHYERTDRKRATDTATIYK